MDKKTNIKTLTDLGLISYLFSKGFKEATLPQREGKRVFFYFKDTPELEKEMNEFYFGEPCVNAQTYVYHLRRLRTIIGEFGRDRG